MTKIYNALNARDTLKNSPLIRSNGMRIFGDIGKSVMYTCVGVQVSQNSCKVCDAAPWMKELLLCQIKLMRCVECSFEEISDHHMLSHLYHAKNIHGVRVFSSKSALSVQRNRKVLSDYCITKHL